MFLLYIGQPAESQCAQDIMVSSSDTMESTGLSFMQKEFQAATDRVLAKATEGLTPSAMRDPRRRAELENIASELPSFIPGVPKAKELLHQLVIASRQLQLAYEEFESSSVQRKMEIEEAQRELAALEKADKVQAQNGTLLDEKCSAQEKLVASLTEQLNAAANTLKELQQKKEQYLQGDSSRKADIKRCDENLLNATKELEQASADLQSKDAKLGGEVGLLLEGLKNYRSPN